MASNGRRGNQGIGNRDGVPATQRPRQSGDMRGHRHAGQESQQLNNLPFLTGSQEGAGQQLTFRYDRDGRSHASTFHLTQEPIGERITAQVIDQDIRIDEILGQLPNLTGESLFPLPSEPSLIPAAVGQAASQQAGRLRDDAHVVWPSGAPRGGERSDHPFDSLQLVFQSFDLVDDTAGLHQLPPAMSLACLAEVCQCGAWDVLRGMGRFG